MYTTIVDAASLDQSDIRTPGAMALVGRTVNEDRVAKSFDEASFACGQSSCGYVYRPEGGLPFRHQPASFVCPVCQKRGITSLKEQFVMQDPSMRKRDGGTHECIANVASAAMASLMEMVIEDVPAMDPRRDLVMRGLAQQLPRYHVTMLA